MTNHSKVATRPRLSRWPRRSDLRSPSSASASSLSTHSTPQTWQKTSRRKSNLLNKTGSRGVLIISTTTRLIHMSNSAWKQYGLNSKIRSCKKKDVTKKPSQPLISGRKRVAGWRQSSKEKKSISMQLLTFRRLVGSSGQTGSLKILTLLRILAISVLQQTTAKLRDAK